MQETSNLTAEDCLDNIGILNADLQPYQTLSLLVPTDDRVWTERDQTWMILFKLATGLLAFAYLIIGIAAVFLIIKKDALVLPAHTFFAVYLSMAILGISRALLFVLDPFGIIGFIREPFPAWIIVSRFLGSVGFPSLIASCTLIIFTLIKLVETKAGMQWYESWPKVLIVLCVPYAIALAAESLGHINTYTALFSGLVCEVFFVIWGVTICVSFLVAGTRLLRKVDRQYRRATNQFVSNDRRMKRIKRKIIKITFGTAIAGIFYSLVSAGGVIMVLLLIGSDCMGFQMRRTDSATWLAIQFLNFVAEILLAICVFYSITDVSRFTRFFQNIFCKQFASRQGVGESSASAARDQEEGMQGSDSSAEQRGPVENQSGSTLTDMPDGQVEVDMDLAPSDISIQLEKFTLNVKKSSNSSIETVPAELVEQERETPRLPKHMGSNTSLTSDRGRETPRPEQLQLDSSESMDKSKGRKSRQRRQDSSESIDSRGRGVKMPSKCLLDTEEVARIFSINDSPPHQSKHVQKLFRSHHNFQRGRESAPCCELSEAQEKSPRRLRQWKSQAITVDRKPKLSVDLTVELASRQEPVETQQFEVCTSLPLTSQYLALPTSSTLVNTSYSLAPSVPPPSLPLRLPSPPSSQPPTLTTPTTPSLPPPSHPPPTLHTQ